MEVPLVCTLSAEKPGKNWLTDGWPGVLDGANAELASPNLAATRLRAPMLSRWRRPESISSNFLCTAVSPLPRLRRSCPGYLRLTASLAIGINQCEVGRRIVFLLQRKRINGDKHLECGRYECFDEVSTTRRSIASAHHDMRVQCGLALIESEVTRHRRNLDLLMDRVLTIQVL